MSEFTYKLEFIDGLSMIREWKDGKLNCTVFIERNQNMVLEFNVPVGKTFKEIANFSSRILKNRKLKEFLEFDYVAFEFNGLLCMFNSSMSKKDMYNYFYNKRIELNI